jgi:hypothetical protein
LDCGFFVGHKGVVAPTGHRKRQHVLILMIFFRYNREKRNVSTNLGRQDMPQNGDISKTFGVYRTLCCGAEIILGVGAAFPDCPNHENLPTEWKQITDVDPATYEPNKIGKINLSKRRLSIRRAN